MHLSFTRTILPREYWCRVMLQTAEAIARRQSIVRPFDNWPLFLSGRANYRSRCTPGCGFHRFAFFKSPEEYRMDQLHGHRCAPPSRRLTPCTNECSWKAFYIRYRTWSCPLLDSSQVLSPASPCASLRLPWFMQPHRCECRWVRVCFYEAYFNVSV